MPYRDFPSRFYSTQLTSLPTRTSRWANLLSKIHHAAFDAHLIGIDPDYRIHVSDRLLTLHDGPMLEALKV